MGTIPFSSVIHLTVFGQKKPFNHFNITYNLSFKKYIGRSVFVKSSFVTDYALRASTVIKKRTCSGGFKGGIERPGPAMANQMC